MLPVLLGLICLEALVRAAVLPWAYVALMAGLLLVGLWRRAPSWLLPLGVGVTAYLGVIGAPGFGARFGAKRLFFENPDYQLSQIQVQTDGTLQRDQILDAAELREGENIFSVNLAQVRDRLLQLPQVDEGVPERPRHPGVDLRQDQVRRLHRRPDHVHRDAEAAVAVRVRRADLDQRHVDPHPAAADQLEDHGEQQDCRDRGEGGNAKRGHLSSTMGG
jgi:hypothetical protein